MKGKIINSLYMSYSQRNPALCLCGKPKWLYIHFHPPLKHPRNARVTLSARGLDAMSENNLRGITDSVTLHQVLYRQEWVESVKEKVVFSTVNKYS